jgi:hypothetical protein
VRTPLASVILATLALLVWSNGACDGELSFVCHADSACLRRGQQGTCEPSGFCSLPDPSCTSGRRYVEQAPASHAGRCADPTSDAGSTDASVAPLADAKADAASDLEIGLLGHWPFDEGTDVVTHDVSGGGRDGTLSLGASWTQGISGSAIRFNGAGGRVALDVPGLGTSSFAAFAWVNSVDASGAQSRIVGVWLETNYAYLNFDRGTPSIEAKDDKGAWWGAGVSPNAGSPSVSIGDGQWHHVGMIVDRELGFGRLFVDGEEVGRGPASASGGIFGDPARSYAFTIGSQTDSPNLSLEGVIDEVRLYGRSLRTEEVRALARRP